MRCEAVTMSARMCKREATVLYLKDDAVVKSYCAQHDAGAGVMRMLKPYPWEYDRKETR